MRERHGRYYIYENELLPKEKRIIELPVLIYKTISFDIGFAASGSDISFHVTYSCNPEKETAIWVKLDKSVSNKSVRAIRVTNLSNKKERICIRIAF